ncbi:hypothetical protein BGX23_002532 [Mortierella sp. AD031]|nr:hypothetical protein BGX23_002532 [Mortierella sp. AD031]KAG0212008.1 hypothetical protein BGX33_003935 [Mortierella sp. NVP41]
MRLSALICSVTLVLHPDFYNSSGNNQVSLLTHFPNLKKWVMKRLQHEPQRHMNRIRNEVNEHCRNLKRLHMDYSTGPNVVMVCRDIFSNLTSFQFTYTELSAELLTSILLHQDTLKSLSAHHSSFGSGFDRPSVSPIVDHFQASGRLLQLIPQSCARLTDLCFPGHEMDMCIVETVTWKCTELKDLRIRIKALNTRERIATAIGLLNSARSTRSQALLKPRTKTPRTPVAKEKKTRSTTKNGPGASGFMDDSIEARVARFLFKFEHLQRVWLGDHFWSV